MNLLCNAVDFCFLDGLYTCRFRYGHAHLSNTITQCEVYEITTSKDCPDGLFLRAQGICKIMSVLSDLALGKHAEQSSTHLSYGAEYAVDGNRGTNILKDKCAHTYKDDTNPWWRVDLQAVYSIISVRILNRGIDEYGDFSFRLRDVTVTVGLTESDVNTPCGFFAGPGTLSQLVVIDCPTLPQGRFVKISKTTRALTLCEVDVFGVSV
ncbi:fucolectin-like [Crassostrea angulata]|uniref:fucolectin-like n=1 Tax=Magallana angulata TaxID=2784310 RepID=UPI0022B2074C|nr:fucolectin-like [Crassostrea angulata]